MTDQSEQDLETYPFGSEYVDLPQTPLDMHRDPYRPFSELARKHNGIVAGRNNIYDGVFFPNNVMFPDQDRDTFLVVGWEAMKTITGDPQTFSSHEAYMSIRMTFGEVLPSMDPPEHTSFKKLVQPAFSHRMVVEELEAVARPIIDRTLQSFAKDGRAELISQFNNKFPYLVIAELLGVPEDMLEEATQNTTDAFRIASDPEKGMAAFGKMDAMYQRVIDTHIDQPRDDLIGFLLDSTVDDRKLTNGEVLDFIKLLIAAGLDTSSRQMGNLLYLLLTHEEQFELLKQDRLLIDGAIWESLRICSSAGAIPRVATRDVEVCGTHIPAGSGIYIVPCAANYDEGRWPDPFRFDITRQKIPLASFGMGIHACLGMNLALSELRIALTGVLDNLHDLRKDSDQWVDVEVRGIQLRSPTKLPVLWDVAA